MEYLSIYTADEIDESISVLRSVVVVVWSAPVHMARVQFQANAWGAHLVMLGHCQPTMLNVKRLATCSTRGGSREVYITFASTIQIRQNPLWLWNPEEASPEIQIRGISVAHVTVGKNRLKTYVKGVKRISLSLTLLMGSLPDKSIFFSMKVRTITAVCICDSRVT